MNAARLRTILTVLKREIDEGQTVEQLSQLLSALSNQLSQPQQTQHQQQVSTAYTNLIAALAKAPSNEFSPLWRQMVGEMGLSDKVGIGLKTVIEELFARNQITVAVARDEIGKIHGAVSAVKSAIGNVLSGFTTLNIGVETLEPGQCEVGILVPRAFVNSSLDDFGAELHELSGILNTFAELATESRPGFVMRSISSSDFSVFLDGTPRVCVILAVAISWLITQYKKLLKVRKLHSELKQLEMPAKNLQGIEQYANDFMSNAIEEFVETLMTDHYKGKDGGRKHEMKIALRIALKRLANRIDRGFNIEIRIEPIREADAKAKAKAAGKSAEEQEAAFRELQEQQTAIQTESRSLQYIRAVGDPILSLPESAEIKNSAGHSETET